MWSDSWIGLPYLKLGRSVAGCDCLGLFLMLQTDRHGRRIPDPMCDMAQAARSRVINQYRPSWREVADAQEGDAVLFRAGRAWHIGYCLGGQMMLHIEDARGSLIEQWSGTRWGNRMEGVYRFGA
jgi:cell wall-associated NlpC family hydrolase